MKAILLAAAALVAVPAIAQTDPAASGVAAPQSTTPPTTDGMDTAPAGDTMQTPAPTDSTQPMPADPSMGGQMTPPAGTTGAAQMNNGQMNNGQMNGGQMGGAPMGGADPAGGYQPSGPALQGTAAPGATVRFQPAADPNTAYPPPAPLQSYPVCKKGQYDKCRNPGGR